MCCMRLAENTGRKKSPKICHLRTIAQLCRALSLQLRHVTTIGKKLIKHQYLLHTSWQYGELWPISGWDRFGSLGYPSKFQRVLRVGFITAPTSLNGRKPNFARCLAISWAGTLYIFLGGSCLLREFCQVQNSLCVQVLHCLVLAALLHGTWAMGVSQTLQRGTRNGIRDFYRGRHLYSAGRPSQWTSAHILVFLLQWLAYVTDDECSIWWQANFQFSHNSPVLCSVVGCCNCVLPHLCVYLSG